MSEVAIIGAARPLRPAFMGATWLLPLDPEPGADWLHAFGNHYWGGPLGLRLQPPVVIRVDGDLGVGLHSGHVDGSIAPYRQIQASVLAAIEHANAVAAGLAPAAGTRPMAERHLRDLLRRSQRPTSQP